MLVAKALRIGWLALRLQVAWALLSLLGLMAGDGAGFCLAFALFPLVGLGVALLGLQATMRWYWPSEAPSPEAFQRGVLPWDGPAGDALAALEAMLKGDLGASAIEKQEGVLMAQFAPPAWSGAWRRFVQTDELQARLRSLSDPSGATVGNVVDVQARPQSRLLYALFWFDRGRNFRRLQRLQALWADRQAQARRQEEEAWRQDSLEGRLAQAELLLLRAQVEPHFLFNTLAHLQELLRAGEAARGAEMVEHLIAYSRSVSERLRRPTHSLAQEAEAARGFLALIQLRFGDRIGAAMELAPESLGCAVPVGSLLIPVENAVKHGLEPRPGAGLVAVRGHVAEGVLHLEVEDDGLGLQSDQGGRRGGLSNLRERLNLLHGEAARLRVESRESSGVRVRIQLPAEPAPV